MARFGDLSREAVEEEDVLKPSSSVMLVCSFCEQGLDPPHAEWRYCAECKKWLHAACVQKKRCPICGSKISTKTAPYCSECQKLVSYCMNDEHAEICQRCGSAVWWLPVMQAGGSGLWFLVGGAGAAALGGSMAAIEKAWWGSPGGRTQIEHVVASIMAIWFLVTMAPWIVTMCAGFIYMMVRGFFPRAGTAPNQEDFDITGNYGPDSYLPVSQVVEFRSLPLLKRMVTAYRAEVRKVPGAAATLVIGVCILFGILLARNWLFGPRV